MRSRVLGIVLLLVALLVFGLGIPLALSVAGSEQQRLFLDRLTDTSRFASVAQRPLTDDQPALMSEELLRYKEVYGIDVLVVDRDGNPQVSSAGDDAASPIDLADPQVHEQVQAALAGRTASPGPLLLPWNSRPMLMVGPVLVDGEVRGAVLTLSPTEHTRDRVWWSWALLGAGVLLVFGLAVLLALPVVRWVMRPVRRLDEATGSLVSAVVGGRPVEPVADGHGPPELRKLGRSFDQMATSVADALAAQRAFVADASHQLRNPLTALKLRLVNLEGQVDAAADEHRVAAAAETERLRVILDDLLSMARSDDGAGELVEVDVDAVVAERVREWQVVADSRQVSLTVVGSAGGPARAEGRGLDKILDALLDNALKFTEAGSSVEVAVAAGERITIAVRDHGPGIRPDELGRATDRFWRSPAHQNVQGSGLGLAIVSRIAQRAGGSLELDLPDGGGLRATVSLPAAQRASG